MIITTSYVPTLGQINKCIKAINQMKDTKEVPDFFFVNSKGKARLLHVNLLNEFFIYSVNNAWEAFNINDSNIELFEVTEDILQQTKPFAIKGLNDIETTTVKINTNSEENNTQTKFEEEEEGSVEVVGVSTACNSIKNNPFTTLDTFLSHSPLMQLSLVSDYLYSLFDPDYIYYGAIKNEVNYTIHQSSDFKWYVTETDTNTPFLFVSMSYNVLNNLATYLNNKSITLDDILDTNEYISLLTKLSED